MFHVKEQTGDRLMVQPFWNMDSLDTESGKAVNHSLMEMSVEDVWVCVNSLTEKQKACLEELGWNFRFHEDTDALPRLAQKLDLDLTHIVFDDESEDGTWFTCLRLDDYRHILPDNLHIYSLRASDDDDSQPASIEDRVMVNHYGDILTGKAMPVPMELEVEPVEYDDEDNIIG